MENFKSMLVMYQWQLNINIIFLIENKIKFLIYLYFVHNMHLEKVLILLLDAWVGVFKGT